MLKKVVPFLSLAAVAAHTPAGNLAEGTKDDPTDLGDITKNSWAITRELAPGEVKYYSFKIDAPTTASSNINEKFYMGYYTPGAGEPGFTFYVAVFGMSSDTQCERWGDGWGRRLAGDHEGGHPEPHDDDDGHDHDHDSHSHGDKPHRITSEGTTWLMDSSDIPERVVGKHDGHAHTHEGFDYHKPDNTLVFIASPKTDLPNKFESFSPTLFKPRGSCIAPFPRGGEYRIAVWGDANQKTTHKFSVGIGLAERDVFAPVNLILFDYLLFDIQTWNGWNGFVLVLPLLAGLVAAVLALAMLKKHKPHYYGTVDGMATPFRALLLICSGIFGGHVIMNISILTWATSNAEVHSSSELVFPLALNIIIPTITTLFTCLMGLNVPICCCCAPKSAAASAPYRAAALLFGILQLFLHAGYIVTPVTLIITALLPPSIANKGLGAAGAAADAAPKKGKGVAVSKTNEGPYQTTPSADEAVSAPPSPPGEMRSNKVAPYVV